MTTTTCTSVTLILSTELLHAIGKALEKSLMHWMICSRVRWRDGFWWERGNVFTVISEHSRVVWIPLRSSSVLNRPHLVAGTRWSCSGKQAMLLGARTRVQAASSPLCRRQWRPHRRDPPSQRYPAGYGMTWSSC